jgi:flagellar basal body-associated protein FliL
MDEIVKAATSGDMVLLLAAIVALLGGVVAALFWLLIKEKDARVKRSEDQFDEQGELFDKLEQKFGIAISVAQSNADVAKKAADMAQASLDELRKRT